MKTIAPFKIVLVMFLIFVGTISKTNAQEIQPLQERVTLDNIRGNLMLTGNDIVGVLERSGVDYNPNDPFNLLGEVSNGGYTTAYIDVDNDPTTFSSSEADLRLLEDPTREVCSDIVYAGLYWSANYYMARDDDVENFSEDEISSSSETDAALIINNGPLAQEYTVRYSEFDSDNSDIQFSPVTSYLVVAQPENGCGITNAAELDGNIAVVREGGSCSFREKVVNAQAAGAVGVVIVNDNGFLPRLTGDGPTINIISVSIGNDDIDNTNVNNGDLITELQAQTNVVLGTLSTIDDDQETGLPANDPRKEGPADFRNIKFKVPGGSYVDVTAQNTGGVIFDGYAGTTTNIDLSTGLPNVNANDEVQYVCYADVTGLIDPNNQFGTYTVADMNATQGQTDSSDGACGGWFLVVVYEDPEESSKFISTRDGYVQIFSGGADVDFNYTGFTTLSGNQPIEVRYGAAGLEGDRGLELDALEVQNAAGGFTPLGEGTNDNTDVNATNNFFASTISFNHQHITARNPASTNTMGFDADLFDLNNDGNLLIDNDQTSATFRLNTDQDRYSVFFSAFSVTIIEPELRIIKRVFETNGTTEITGGNVELGDELFYDLEIENIGNEDFVDGSVVITDILPANTNLLGVVDATLPPGVTYTETTPGTLVFNIPSSIVETDNDGEGDDDAPIFIRFRAQLVNSCEELRDACSDVIQNVATATYTGERSGQDGATLSSSEVGVCGDTPNESTNILVNVPACSQEVTFCNNNLTLVAGEGYDRYTWSGPGIVTPIVQELATNSTPYVFNVPSPQTGTYTVIKEDTNPADGTCMTLTEEFVVEDFRDITNPVLDYVNGTTVVTEDCSGLPIPQILLCGDQTLLLETNFVNLVNISWQRLSPGGACISDPNDPCSLLSGDCTDTNWVQEPGGDTSSYTVSTAGDYRILAEFEGGCFIPFYFSVFKNDYQPELDMNPIECGNDGSVTVTNVPTNFAFSLTPGGPYNNTTGIFAIPPGSGGDITVYAIDTTFPGCEYTETINVPEIIPTFSVTGENATCINDDNGTGFGTIRIAVTAGSPEYQYTISSPALGAANPIIVPNSSANNGNYTQDNLPPGTYSVEVITNRPSPECIFNQSITLDPPPAFDAEAVLLAPETCESGALVQINVLNGSGNYRYADSGGSFQTSNIFEIPAPADPTATYTFFVSDQDVLDGSTPACIIEVNIDNITPYIPIVIDNVNVTQPACPGDSGQIQVEVSPTVAGRTYTYELLTSVTATDTIFTQVDQIVSNLQDITFVNVADNDFYTVQVSHNNTTPPGTTPPTICPVRLGVFAIDSPDVIDATVTLERPLSCIVGSEDALIRIAGIGGGSGTYEWSFDNVSFTNITSDPTDIPVGTAGSYTVYIRNQATGDCAVPFVIDVPDRLEVDDITFTNGDNNCTNQTTEVTFNAQPTPLPTGEFYEYEVTPNPTTNTGSTGFDVTNTYTFTQGITYTVVARRSDSQCFVSRQHVVDPIDQIDITSANQTSPVSCLGGNDGAFSFTVDTTLFPTFNYEITGPAPATTIVVSGTSNTSPVTIESPAIPLIAGTYTITVTDPSTSATDPAANCSDTETVVITEPTTNITFDLDVNQICTTNTVTVSNVMGANGTPYTMTLTHPTNGTNLGPIDVSLPFENIPNDTGYVITVSDAQGCSTPETFDINALPPVVPNVTARELCLDDGVATLTIDITNGTPGTAPDPLYTYTVSRDGVQIIGTTDVTALPFTTPDLTQDGTYVVTITDSVGCSEIVTQVIEPAVDIVATLTKDITCDVSGNPDAAQVDFTIAGGYTPYDIDYTTDGGATFTNHITGGTAPFATFTTTTPGTYQFRVTDSGVDTNCTDLSLPIEITVPVGPTITAPDVTLLCDGDTGLINISVTGTDPSYEIDFENTGTYVPLVSNQAQFNRGQGTYDFTIRDSRGCEYPDSVEVISPGPIVVDTFLETPLACDPGTGVVSPGRIDLTIVDRGVLTYTYTLVEESNVSIRPLVPALDINGNPVAPQTILSNSVSFTNLDFGRYYIFVEDQNGCEERLQDPIELEPFEIASPVTDLDITAVPTTTCPNLVTLDVRVDGGVGPFTIEIVGIVPVFGPPLNNPPRDHQFTGLPFDTVYEIEVVDTNTGCRFVEFVDPVPPPAEPDLINFEVTSVSCNDPSSPLTDGSISFDIDTSTLGAGVTSVSWQVYFSNDTSLGAAYAGSSAVGSIPSPIIINNLGAGLYYIIVQEDDGTLCPGRVDFEIETPDLLVSTAINPTVPECTDEAVVTINTNGGTPTGGLITPEEGYFYYLTNRGGPAPVTNADYTINSNVITLDLDADNDGTIDQTQFDIYTRDDNGCPHGPLEIDVTVIPGPTITAPPFATNACDTNDFSVTVTSTATALNTSGNVFYAFDDATDATDPIVFVEGPVGSFTYTIPNPGTYNLTIRDANGCENVDQIIIYPPVDVSAAVVFDCIDGDITVTATGGSGNYEYVLLDDVGGTVRPQQVSNQFLAVVPGDYVVQVIDTGMGGPAPGCPYTAPISIGTPITPVLLTTGVEDVTCFNGTDGSITVTIDPTTIDPLATYTYEIFELPGLTNPPAYIGPQTSPTFSDLPAGDYRIVVIALANGVSCPDDQDYTIGQPLEVTATAVQGDQFDCIDPTNATIVIDNVANGSGTGYTVTITQPDGVIRTDIPITSVPFTVEAPVPGVYTVEVFDSNDCPAPPLNPNIVPLVPMSNPAVVITQDSTCAVDEIVEVSVQGGSGNFLFERIDNTGAVLDTQPANPAPNNNTANFTLPRVPVPTIYTFRITDQGDANGLGLGCEITVTHEVDEYDFIEVVAVQQTPESCFGDADGEISITITGYTGTFDFQVYQDDGTTAVVGANGNGNATADPFVFTLPITLAQGTYIVGVTETADPLCTELSNVVSIVGPAAPIALQISPINTQESCVPGSDGSFQAFTTGQQGVVTYTIAPAAQPANTTGLFENLPAGAYTVTAVDANGCTDDDTITINAPNPILVDPIADSSVTCFGDTNGSITVSANGGQGPGTYLYTLTFPDGTTTSGPQSSNMFNNLGPGTYNVTVSDNLNCSASTTAIINEPNEVTVSIDTVTEVECGVDTINVTISGTSDGTITQYYYVDQDGNEVPNGGSGTFIGLTAGEYQFFVEDNNGCRSQLAGPVPVIPINPIVIVLDERFANINCFNEATGIIDATVSGGIGDYVFDLINNTTGQTWGPQSTSEFRDLPAGNYTYTVRTDRNCIDQENFDIVNPPEFLNVPPDATDVLCFGEDNGQIVVFAQGGTPPYSFAISTDPDQFFNDDSDDDPNQHTFTMLAPGTYQVFAQDSQGCGQVYDVTINEPTQLIVNVDGAITPETCLGDSDGAVTIAITGGTAPYFTSITNVDADFVQDLLTYTDLPGGVTTIYVRDSNNCTQELPVFIPEGVMLNADLNPRLECPEWDYTDPMNPVMTQGPRYFVDFVLGPNSVMTDIQYMLTGINGTADPAISLNNNGIFEVLPGEYEGTMEHVDGCIEVVGTILIEDYMPLTVPIATMTNNPQDPNEYMIEVNGGIEDYTFFIAILPDELEGSALASAIAQLTDSDFTQLDGNIFSIRETANYIIRVVDESGCEVIGTQLLTYINIRIPNYFTPDRDDPTTEEDDRYWYPRQISPNDSDPFFFENIEVKVFDRYGRLLKEFQGDQKGWSGIYQGSMLPSGDYWYTVILNDIDNREFTGHFTLYRM